MTPVFFDTFFNLEKYLDHEQRDPFATQREVDEDGNEVRILKWNQQQFLILCPQLSDWDRFAADEYEQLVAEEGSNDLMEDMWVRSALEMQLVQRINITKLFPGVTKKVSPITSITRWLI